MFHTREIITAVELGTSKICVLIGETGADGRISVIGSGTVPSLGSIVKGEIDNMELAFDQLGAALDEADKSSHRELGNTRLAVVTVTGCGIDSYQGAGSVFIKNEEHRVTERDRLEAHENARFRHLASDREIINSSESYFTLDERRMRNPLDQIGRRLDAYVHVVHGLAARIENFRSIIRESGFEDSMIDVVFAPLAVDAGILTEEERENGVVLIDLGAGTTEFLVAYNRGVLASGVLQVGFDHICNDLSVGLELHIGVCRKLIEEGTLGRAMREKREFIEFPGSTGKVRRIPLASFETIIDLRLREIFEILRQTLAERGALGNLDAGGVLTGGGALFERTGAVFREVFDLGFRVGQPQESGLPVPGAEGPRFSSVWGALKIASYYNTINGGPEGRLRFRKLFNVMDFLGCRTRRAFESVREIFGK